MRCVRSRRYFYLFDSLYSTSTASPSSGSLSRFTPTPAPTSTIVSVPTSTSALTSSSVSIPASLRAVVVTIIIVGFLSFFHRFHFQSSIVDGAKVVVSSHWN